jgi:uncharacterized protein YdbL (DUF1318 family)
MNRRILLILGWCGALLLVPLAPACTPQVKVVGDKDKPIPINAEIKIHIYQHAAGVVDQLQEGVEEQAEEPEAEPSALLERGLLRVLRAISISSAHAAEAPVPMSWRAAFDAMQQAYRTALPLLRSGMLGENREGYVTVINKGGAPASAQADAATTAAALNQARRAFYTLDAQQQGIALASLQATYAKAFRESKKVRGIWVEVLRNGQWAWEKN